MRHNVAILYYLFDIFNTTAIYTIPCNTTDSSGARCFSENKEKVIPTKIKSEIDHKPLQTPTKQKIKVQTKNKEIQVEIKNENINSV